MRIKSFCQLFNLLALALLLTLGLEGRAAAQSAVSTPSPSVTSPVVTSPSPTASPIPNDLNLLLTPVATLSATEAPLSAPSQATLDLFKKGLEAYQAKDFENATTLLEKALASQELGSKTAETAEANAAMGDLYQNHWTTEGHLEMARTYYMAALEADPANATAKKGLEEMGSAAGGAPSEASSQGATTKLPEPSSVQGRNGEKAVVEGTGDYFRVGLSLPGLGGNFDGNELGQIGSLAGGNEPFFFLPQANTGYGFTGSIGRCFGNHISAELCGFIAFLNSTITQDQTIYQRTYLEGNHVNPNLTAIGVDLRFLYELPLESSFKISPFVGLNYQSISMTNAMIDQIGAIPNPVPTNDYTFGSYGTEAGLYLGYELSDEFQLFVCGQLPVVSIFSNNPNDPPHVHVGGGVNDLNTAYESLTLGLKVTIDTQAGAEQ